MPKCLGIYIEDNVIKYAKLDKNKDVIKVEASSVVFYEKNNLFQTIEKIVKETFSSKEMISINISNEIYNYFDVFSALKPADRKKSIDVDFEFLCGEKGYNKESLESRYLLRSNRENNEKLRAIHISTNKENLRKRLQDFSGFKVVSATPISTSIYNLIDPYSKNENIIIVNIEKETKVTTVIDGEAYSINIIPEGMGEILEGINRTENSMQKAYDCCKNITIYTKEAEDLQNLDASDHLDEVMPTLYRIVTEVKKILDSTIASISKVYITGLGTAINNIDLYFQEYIQTVKCELLRPFFVENGSIKMPIRDYIEVNSAIAIGLEGLGYGNKDLNFRTKSEDHSTSFQDFLNGFTNWRAPLVWFDKTMLRILACICVGVVGYAGISTAISDQIAEKSEEVSVAEQEVTTEIALVNAQTSKIDNATETYNSLIEALTSDDEDDTSVRIIEKDSIPNLLNKIVYVIPSEVQITSIKNTESTHIVIEAQAEKYEQLGYFKAVLSTKSILLNVQSDSGTKSNDVVTITIEGDLP